MKKLHLILLLTLIIWVISLITVYNKGKQKYIAQDETLSYSYFSGMDTVVNSYWNYSDFQFYLNFVQTDYGSVEKIYTSIHLNKTNQDYYLFDCHSTYGDYAQEPTFLFDDIMAFPYHTGGKYSRCAGLELIKITSDTVIYIGPVCGYEDIDKDKRKEFFVYVISEYGICEADHKFEKIEVTLKSDSLFYPFPRGEY